MLYISRTKAIKKLQITLRDFRRLCILKGIYPREPPKQRTGDVQTYYHIKDISYLAHEPLLAKFREFKVFMRKVRKAANRHDLKEARRIYEQKQALHLDHLIKERYPRFEDALQDMDDCLSMLHLFSTLPSYYHIKPETTATAQRLVREWQYYVARSHSLRKVFLSIKGVYFQAEIKGVPITWLQPWQFNQSLPTNVDYKIMLTFLEFHEQLAQFVMFKLFHGLGLSYPPKMRMDVEAMGGHLGAVAAHREKTAEEKQAEAAAAAAEAEAAAAAGRSNFKQRTIAAMAPLLAAEAGAAAKGGAGAAAGAGAAVARLASLKDKLKSISSSSGATGEEGALVAADKKETVTLGSAVTVNLRQSGGPERKSVQHPAFAAAAALAERESSLKKARDLAKWKASPSLYNDFVLGEMQKEAAAEGEDGAMEEEDGAAGEGTAEILRSMEEFGEQSAAEARRLREKLSAERSFQRLFRGCVFFLNREVPRELFEFLVCAFSGRVGWDGPGSPIAADDPSITHHVWDRPLAPGQKLAEGREYVQPQWLADSINARMLLPTGKYAPGAVLPPHLSPFVEDNAEGYVPAYRQELDRLRAAAAVTGRLADVLEAGEAAPVPTAVRKEEEEEEEEDSEDEEGEEEEEGEEDEEEDGEDDSEDEDEEEEDEEEDDSDAESEIEELLQAKAGKKARAADGSAAAVAPAGKKGAAPVIPGPKLSQLEAERRALAASMLSAKKRRTYEIVSHAVQHKKDKVATLEAKRQEAEKKGDSGTGKAAAEAAAAKAAAAAPKGSAGAGKASAAAGGAGKEAAGKKPAPSAAASSSHKQLSGQKRQR